MNELKQNLKHFVKNKPVQASIVSGLLFGCSFPPFPFPFQLLGLLAIAIWVEIIRGASSHRLALTYLFYGLLPANLVVSYWLTMATIGGGIAAVLAKAVVMSLMLFPFILLIRTTHYKASMFQVFVLTAAWIFAEGIDLY
jgi:apolipoprotein N-acyltransferase